MTVTINSVTSPAQLGEHRSIKGNAWHPWFNWFARETSRLPDSPLSFLIAALLIVVWAATGPQFHYSDTWQLVINTGTTIITFLMVFLIQNTAKPRLAGRADQTRRTDRGDDGS